MSLPALNFVDCKPGTQEYNAIHKALRECPRVLFLAEANGMRYYEVTSTNKLGRKYPVRMWWDKDKQPWIECFCHGAYPPLEESTRLIAWVPKVCYHMAAVLIHECNISS